MDDFCKICSTCSFTVQSDEHVKHFKTLSTNFVCVSAIRNGSQAKMSNTSPEKPWSLFCAKIYFIVNLPKRDWMFPFTVNTRAKECGSDRSSRLLFSPPVELPGKPVQRHGCVPIFHTFQQIDLSIYYN